MSARAQIEAPDAIRILRELRAEKIGWRKTCDEAQPRRNPPEWFAQQDDYIAALDFALATLSAPTVSKNGA